MRISLYLFQIHFFSREKEHVKGFAPETAVVTIGGGEKLVDPFNCSPYERDDYV